MVIKHGMVALPGMDEPTEIDIKVENGIIIEIAKNIPADAETIDASGLFVLPGGIDPHVHFDDPGYTHREDFYAGSCAAASGGITTVIDMPCTSIPPVTNRKNLLAKLSVVSAKSVVDYGFFGGISSQSFEGDVEHDIAELAEFVLGFKIYFISGMESFGRLNHFQAEKAFKLVAKHNLPVLVHAEDFDYVSAATEKARMLGNSPKDYYYSRPEIAEILAISAAVEIAKSTGTKIHIVHVGTADAVEIIKRYPQATCETAPHYLMFDINDLMKMGSILKTTPPVKSPENKQKLWEMLSDGQIDFVASDHAPCPNEEKNTGSLWTDYSGIPGVQTLLPFVFSEGFMKSCISLSRLLEITSAGAAKRYGLYEKKGSIEVGKHADLVIIDPTRKWRVKGKEFFSKGKLTPFERMEFCGSVVRTILRGNVIYDIDYGVVAHAGYGKFIEQHKLR